MVRWIDGPVTTVNLHDTTNHLTLKLTTKGISGNRYIEVVYIRNRKTSFSQKPHIDLHSPETPAKLKSGQPVDGADLGIQGDVEGGRIFVEIVPLQSDCELLERHPGR